LDTYIPIECKDWREPVGAPEVTQFISKLSLFKCNTGILLSKEGIKEETVNELKRYDRQIMIRGLGEGARKA